jgi:eukaryotic-like serine/threonine-protein kinase
MSDPRPEPRPPEIPGYTFESMIGRGGMGVVWKARQHGTNRPVAVKMILARDLPGLEQMVRFRLEAELISQAQDPHIVQIFHTGEVDGLPYLVMEFVGGGTLSDRIRGRPYAPREAAELLRTIARAMGQVHHKGIVHRDLKPANVLMTEDGEPKVGDFGLARALAREASDLSRSRIMGTVEYMSPEQARGGSRLREIAAPADVFAMGVMLFELLTGQLPFHSDSQLETLNLVSEAKPRPPRSLRDGIPRDLESICLMCLRKEPRARYADGMELADDLGRFLRGEPIRARYVGRAERAWLWCLRNPLATALFALTMIGAVLANNYRLENARRRLAELNAELAGSNERAEKARGEVLAAEAKADRAQAEEQGRQAEANAYFNRIIAVDRDLDAGHLAEAGHLLEACPAPLRDWEWNHLVHRLNTDRLRIRLQDARGQSIDRHGLPLAFGPDGSRLILGPGITVDLRGRLPRPPELLMVRVDAYRSGGDAWSADGSLSASFAVMTNPPHRVNIRHWEAAVLPDSTRKLDFSVRATLDGHTARILKVGFSPDARRLVSVSEDHTIRVWDLETGREIRRLDLPGDYRMLTANVAFSPDGRTVACLIWSYRKTSPGPQFAQEVRDLLVWDVDQHGPRFPAVIVENAEPMRMVPYVTEQDDLVFSPDGQLIAFAASNRAIRLMGTNVGEQWQSYPGHPMVRPRGDAGVKLAFFPDSRRIASGGRDRLVKVWSLSAQDRPELVIPAHDSAITALAVGPDGRSLATSDALEVKLWSINRTAGSLTLDAHTGGVSAFAIHPRGTLMATGGDDPEVRLWDPRTGGPVATLTLPGIGSGFKVSALAFSREGTVLAVGSLRTGWDLSGDRPVVQFWDVDRREHLWTGPGQGSVQALAVAAAGSRFYSAGGDPLSVGGDLWALDPISRRGEPLALPEHTRPLALFIHPTDGHLIVIAHHLIEGSRAVRIDPGTNRMLGQEVGVIALAFDPNGVWMARAKAGGTLEVVDLRTENVVASASFPGRTFGGLAFNREGTRLATFSTFRDAEEFPTLTLWEPRGLREVLTLVGFAGPIEQVAFSADGNLLVTREAGGPIRVWDGTPPAGEVP